MTTIPEVEAAQPDKMVDASRLVGATATLVADQVSTAKQKLTELNSRWQGDGATAASVRGEQDIAREQKLHDKLVAVQGALRDGGNSLSTLRSGILTSVNGLKAQGWQVASNGTVSVTPGSTLDTYSRLSALTAIQVKMLALKNTVGVQKKLAEFTELDAQTTQSLRMAGGDDELPTEKPGQEPEKSPDKDKDKGEPPQDAPADGPVPISKDDITYDKSGAGASGATATDGYINEALDKMGMTDPTARENWKAGYMTLTERETSHNANLVPPKDAADQNNTGAINPQDGEYANATRGITQLTPDNFAKYHQPGTSNNIYDPVAQICASMNYVMDHPMSPTDSPVSRDGHDLRDNIQQADSRRPAHWY